MTTRELSTKSPSGRPRRTPLGVRNKLSIKDKDPNYQYRIVNDTDDRIEGLKEQGYEVVEGAKVGDKRVENSTGLGSSPAFSVGQGTKAVVMRIKREWYEEDQAAKIAQVKKLEDTMRQDAKRASDYGSIEQS
jgi:hypothetical protein